MVEIILTVSIAVTCNASLLACEHNILVLISNLARPGDTGSEFFDYSSSYLSHYALVSYYLFQLYWYCLQLICVF